MTSMQEGLQTARIPERQFRLPAFHATAKLAQLVMSRLRLEISPPCEAVEAVVLHSQLAMALEQTVANR
jgi:hypothetical protein